MAENKLLLINDSCSYGKVALSAMVPVLSHMKHHLFCLPTALVSNNLEYGKFDIVETTDYIINSMKIWDELGFNFDAVSTGFIVSERQAKVIADFCTALNKKGALVFVDPIMGDEGKLYNGVTQKTIDHMKTLVKVSDYTVPNYTEACFLSGVPYTEKSINTTEAEQLVQEFLKLGAKNVVITSAFVDNKDCTIIYDATTKTISYLPFDKIPVRFPGTGDIFSAVFIGLIMDGNSMKTSTQIAMNAVRTMIEINKSNEDKIEGIHIESCLKTIDNEIAMASNKN